MKISHKNIIVSVNKDCEEFFHSCVAINSCVNKKLYEHTHKKTIGGFLNEKGYADVICGFICYWVNWM